MRYALVELDGEPRVGLVVDPGEVPVADASPETTVARQLSTTVEVRLFEPGTDLLSAAIARDVPADDARAVPLPQVTLLAPVHPASFRDFVAFEGHIAGASAMLDNPEAAMARWAEAPMLLFGSPHAMIADGEPVAAPAGSEALDFELEVGVVIGRDGRDLTSEEAVDHIAGYVIVNDWSARDIQRREMQGGLGPVKSKDFATTIGPWLVTPDELEGARTGDRLDLRMSVSINGVEFGSDTLAHMAWSFAELISYASRNAWVRAGDLIASGTCQGGALSEVWGRTGRQEPPPLQPGDVVTMTVEGLGTITNPVVAAAPERSPIPPATRLSELQR